jgi:hypothetical protein
MPYIGRNAFYGIALHPNCLQLRRVAQDGRNDFKLAVVELDSGEEGPKAGAVCHALLEVAFDEFLYLIII